MGRWGGKRYSENPCVPTDMFRLGQVLGTSKSPFLSMRYALREEASRGAFQDKGRRRPDGTSLADGRGKPTGCDRPPSPYLPHLPASTLGAAV